MKDSKQILLEKLSYSTYEQEQLISEIVEELGVRDNTVRRSLKKLESEQKISIDTEDGKIYVSIPVDKVAEDPAPIVLPQEDEEPQIDFQVDGKQTEELQEDEEVSQDLTQENERLKQEISRMILESHVTNYEFSGEMIRFGAVSDTQLGSNYENISLLEAAYNVFEKEGIRRVFHAGDLLDGEKMYRGHTYELHTHGCDAQIAYCVDTYPKRDGIETSFILGNHDGAFWKNAGIDVGIQIDKQRPDMHYLGMDEADVELTGSEGEVILRLYHPRKGTSYAISYQTQKYIEALTGGHKPNILLVGHYHKQEYIFYRNIHSVQTGCFQHQTPFMRGRNLAAMQGFWIIEIALKKADIVRCKTEWFPCYD